LYWTNIENIQQPEDKNIYLKDIIETGDVDRDKSYCIDANYWKGGNLKRYYDKSSGQLIIEKPHQSSKRLMVKIGNIYPGEGQNGNIYSTEGKSPSLSAGIGITGKGIGSSNSPKICIQIGEADIKGHDIIKRVYSPEGKSPSLTVGNSNSNIPKISENHITWRKLTPLECERLQTVPENYTNGVSNTQRYKMLGNGWTVDVIAHIFSYLPLEYKND
jgi:site-specific DNA-cytosine methylase